MCRFIDILCLSLWSVINSTSRSKFKKYVLQGYFTPAIIMKNYNMTKVLTFCLKLFFISFEHLLRSFLSLLLQRTGALLYVNVQTSAVVDLWVVWPNQHLFRIWYVDRVVYVRLIDVYENNTGNLYTKYNMSRRPRQNKTCITCLQTITL